MWASVVVARRLSSCGLWALECRLSSCGARALLLCGIWDLPGPGLDPMSPALAGGFLTTGPPGKPYMTVFELWFSQGICLVVGLLGHMVVLFSVFKGTSILFSIVALSIYIPTNSSGGFPFLHTLSSVYCLQIF